MIQITEDNWNNGEIVFNKGLTVVKASASWCGPCKTYKPIFEEYAEKHFSEDLQFAEADVDENDDLVKAAGIRGVPTTLVYKNGELVAKKSGMINSNELEELIETAKAK